MSRSGYTDTEEWAEDFCEGGDCGECDFCAFRQTVDEAIKSPEGQAFLRELVSAIEVEPKLCSNALLSHEGEVCAIGSVLRQRGVKVEPEDPDDWGSDWAPDEVAQLAEIPTVMAQEIMYENDEWPDDVRRERMLAWAKARLEQA